MSRRQVLAAASSVGIATAASAVAPNDSQRAFAAQCSLLVSRLFERLRQPPPRWQLDELLHDVITFIDVNRATRGEVTGKAKTVEQLRQMHDAGELDLTDWPLDDNVVVRPDWTVFATARPPAGKTGIWSIYQRPIVFGFQMSTPSDPTVELSRPLQISILSVMRPFEPGWAAMSECDVRQMRKPRS